MILNTTKPEGDMLTNVRKAAILLVALGEASSAQLLQQLAEEDVQKVSREVAKLTLFRRNRQRLSSKSSTILPMQGITWRAAVSTMHANY